MRFAVFGALVLIIAGAPSTYANQVAPGDWPHFNRDPASTRYSPLDQITVDNVAALQLAWTYSPNGKQPERDEADPGQPLQKNLKKLNLPLAALAGTGVGIKVVPVVVDGVMYVAAGSMVAAIETTSGKEVWRHSLAEGDQASLFGVNYWPGNEKETPRIVFTSGRQLIALDAATGRTVTGFGQSGVVDTGMLWGGVPVVFGDVIAVGATVMETPQDPNQAGDTRAFDAVTGARKWVFHSVPRPGEMGHETWLDDGWKDRSGTNTWGPHMTVDKELGLLYFTLGSPSSNYYGGDRPGENLFGNSIVAVDGNTGEYRWHFQVVHHDLWDYDLPPAPALVDIHREGKKIPALVQIGKTGWMFILDRRTGEPVFGVEERPVAKGDVPGEWYSPTQPFPKKPPALARMSFSVADLVTAEDTSETHAANCKALYNEYGGFYNAGPFTPFLYRKEGAPPRSTIIFPGGIGGTQWGGMATDQQRGYVFAYTQNLGSIGWVIKKRKGERITGMNEGKSNLPYTRASHHGRGSMTHFKASAGKGLMDYPCQKPPWGQLSAVDANSGEIIWQVPVGIAEDLPEGKRNTGLPYGFAGPTATAGDLVFYAAVPDGKLRAFNSLTGAELWSTDIGYAAFAQPVSYLGSDGRQYVAISVGMTVRAYALPGSDGPAHQRGISPATSLSDSQLGNLR